MAIRSAGAGQYYVGGTIITTTSDFLLIRADQYGKERWRVVYNSTNNGSDTLRALVVDTAGNAYAVGRSSGADNTPELAVLKCTAKGVQKWVARFRDAENRSLDPMAAAVDPAGNLYVVATRPTGSGMYEQLVLRFSTQGQLQWLQTNAQPLAAGDTGATVVTDGAKGAYVVGKSNELITLTRYLPSGAVEWRSVHPGALPTNSAAAAAVDSAGNLHVLSNYRFETDQPEDARVDVQVEKVSRKGSLLWRVWHRGITAATLIPGGLTLEKSGNVSAFGVERRNVRPDRHNLFVVCWDRQGRQRWSAWQEVGGGREVSVTATTRSQGGLGVLIDNPESEEVIALTLDAAGNRRWQETNQFHLKLRGVTAPTVDVLVAAAEVPEADEVPARIVLLGYNVPTEKKPLKMIRAPQAQAVAEGATATFTVVARGNGARPEGLSYRWWSDGELQNDPGVDPDGSSFSFGWVNADFTGEIAVEVITGETAVLSPSARLTLLQPPRIFSAPSRRDTALGMLTWFAAGVDGSEPIHLQWQHDGFDIPGAHDPFLMIPSVSAADAGTYQLVVSNRLGVATSEPASLAFVRTGALDTWSWIEPYPQGNTMAGIAFGAGRFIAATWGGTLLSSRNGADWQSLPPFQDEFFNAITWADGRFVAVGGDNQGHAIIRISNDGTAWTVRALPSSNAMSRVTSGGGIIVAVNSSGTFFRSTNGTDWLQFGLGLTPTALGYGNGLFVAAGGLALLHTSPDGITWTPHILPSAIAATDVAFGGGRFVVVGRGTEMAVSSNGSDWTTISYGANALMSGLVYALNEFIAVSLDGNSYGSVNGLNWYEQSIAPAGFYDVAYGNGVFACVGTGGAVATSPNPGLWTSHTIGGGEKKYRKVHSANNATVVVGDDATVLSSVDGGSFIPCAITAFENYRGVTFGDGLWVAVGDHGAIETSPDSAVWSEAASPTTTDLRGATFGNGRFVVVGDRGGLLTSLDGNDWRPRVSGTTNGLRAVFYGDGNFVAAGEQGTLLTSADGEKWRPQALPTHKELTSVCFGNGLWLVAADNGDVWFSANRTTWKTVETQYKNLTGLAYDNGLFVMIAKGRVLSSVDGKRWEPHVPGIYAELRDLAFENGRVLAVGSDQTIVISGLLQSP
jgi:hypothetical protein